MLPLRPRSAASRRARPESLCAGAPCFRRQPALAGVGEPDAPRREDSEDAAACPVLTPHRKEAPHADTTLRFAPRFRRPDDDRRPGLHAPERESRRTEVGGVTGHPDHAVNLNTASKTELASLPGLTDADADRIIEHRPYNDVSGLLRKKVIGRNKYDQIQDMVYVRQ